MAINRVSNEEIEKQEADDKVKNKKKDKSKNK